MSEQNIPQLLKDSELVQSVIMFLENLDSLFSHSNASVWVSDLSVKAGDLSSSDVNAQNKVFALFALKEAGHLSMVETRARVTFQYKSVTVFFDKSPSERANYYNMFITRYK